MDSSGMVKAEGEEDAWAIVADTKSILENLTSSPVILVVRLGERKGHNGHHNDEPDDRAHTFRVVVMALSVTGFGGGLPEVISTTRSGMTAMDRITMGNPYANLPSSYLLLHTSHITPCWIHNLCRYRGRTVRNLGLFHALEFFRISYSLTVCVQPVNYI